MNEKNLSDNPNLKQIDEKKLILIESLVAQAQQKPEEILPFFLAVNSKAAQMGISFNDTETDMILNALKPKMSSADIRKIDMIRNFTKMMSEK